jgi:hypothetical protein
MQGGAAEARARRVAGTISCVGAVVVIGITKACEAPSWGEADEGVGRGPGSDHRRSFGRVGAARHETAIASSVLQVVEGARKRYLNDRALHYVIRLEME